MKTANLLLNAFLVFVIVMCVWAFVAFSQKTHKPEVEGSSPSLDTTYSKQSQNTKNTVYSVVSWHVVPLFTTIKLGAMALALFLVSLKNAVFEDFYCRITAEFFSILFYNQFNIKCHPT